jgi:hypothetical protein
MHALPLTSAAYMSTLLSLHTCMHGLSMQHAGRCTLSAVTLRPASTNYVLARCDRPGGPGTSQQWYVVLLVKPLLFGCGAWLGTTQHSTYLATSWPTRPTGHSPVLCNVPIHANTMLCHQALHAVPRQAPAQLHYLPPTLHISQAGAVKGHHIPAPNPTVITFCTQS